MKFYLLNFSSLAVSVPDNTAVGKDFIALQINDADSSDLGKFQCSLTVENSYFSVAYIKSIDACGIRVRKPDLFSYPKKEEDLKAFSAFSEISSTRLDSVPSIQLDQSGTTRIPPSAQTMFIRVVDSNGVHSADATVTITVTQSNSHVPVINFFPLLGPPAQIAGTSASLTAPIDLARLTVTDVDPGSTSFDVNLDAKSAASGMFELKSLTPNT
ncbi:unnamed protein product, partial [Protopolystoma xenopodis]